MRIGITGGIGSGKTTVCRVFSTLGIPVFDSDKEAQEIINSDPSVRNQLNLIAGLDLFTGGVLDRKMLAKLIFNDPELLKKVNGLIHPLVINKFTKWADGQKTPYVIMESALLFESGAWSLVDKTISVVAPVEERIQRVSLRNNIPEAEIMDRMKNQISDSERITRSDFVINNGEDDLIIPAILKIHENIMNQITISK